MCLANMNKEGISTHYHLPELVSTTICCLDSAAPATLVMEIGMGLANGEQWSLVNHPVSRNPAVRSIVPSPRAWAAGGWRVMEEHDPRYGDNGQWSLRII